MGWKTYAILAAAVIVIVAIAVALWPEDGGDSHDRTPQDVSLDVRYDLRAGDWMDFEYRFPDLLDMSMPVRVTVTSVDENGVRIVAEADGEIIADEYMDTTPGSSTETEYLGEEAIDTVYGYVTCQKYLETDEGGTVTAWYLDGIVMKIDGTYDGMRCVIDLKDCSFVTPVYSDEVISDGSMFFYDGSSDTFTGSFDVFGQSMILTLDVNEQVSAHGPSIDVRYNIDLYGTGELIPSSIRVETVGSGDIDLIGHDPATGQKFDNYPGMTVVNNSNTAQGIYSVEFSGFGQTDYLSFDGMDSSYSFGERGARIVGEITVSTSQGGETVMFTLTVAAGLTA